MSDSKKLKDAEDILSEFDSRTKHEPEPAPEPEPTPPEEPVAKEPDPKPVAPPKAAQPPVAHPVPIPAPIGKVRASPSVRKLAREIGVNIAAVSALNPKKGVTARDEK